MDPSLARYIWVHTWRQQIWILFVVALSMIPYFMSFDLPKRIVNGPIQGQGFETPGATQPFLAIDVDVPLLGSLHLFDGFQLNRTQTLVGLSLVFLGLVIVNGAFKLYINTYKGRLGERMLRRIRFQLVDRVLRFPPGNFKRIKPSEVATMVKDEVEPLGGFIGDAFVQPALLGGQALTALIFIIVQSFWLGMIAAFIVAIQLVLIPQMRKRLIRLGRERQLTARALSGRVGELVEGIGAIHINDTSNYERADIADRLGRIFKIRYDLYQWKFLVKFINNFLAQVTPFLFYLVGGWFALQGRLDIGQLVAVINAYKDLPGPLKELIDWDQNRQDVQVKYAQVVEQFTVDTIMDEKLQMLTPHPVGPITEPLATSHLSMIDDSGAKVLNRVSVQIHPGEKVAVVGTAAGGAEALAEAFARLAWPESGRISIGDRDLLELPEAVTGRRIAYASSDTYLFQGSLRDNFLYGLKHAPLSEPKYDEDASAQRRWHMEEAKIAGNPDYDPNSDWVDYAAAGATGPEDLYYVLRPVLDAVVLTQDILDLALRSRVDPKLHPGITGRIVEVRQALRQRLHEQGLSSLIASFEPNAYNVHATVGENLLFGAASGSELSDKELARSEYFKSILREDRLGEDLYLMGIAIAENAIELFADLPPDHPFFQQLAFMAPEEIPVYEQLLQRLRGKPFDVVNPEDRVRMIKLSFAYIEPRHRFGLLTPELMDRIVAARHRFHKDLPEDLKRAIERYDPEKYTTAATLIDNVLFGRIEHNQPDGPERIRSLVRELLDTLGLHDEVLDIGLEFNVGVGGRRLTSAQRQKLDLARALLKRGDFLILNRPLSALDQRSQDVVTKNVLEEVTRDGRNPAVIWVLPNAGLANLFERIIVFHGGEIVQDGTPETLSKENGMFMRLVA
ncbi:ABC transporter ATP-binding protein [Pseudaminobacter sp. 19-2017]|uniref:ABC transporter ATP-binding protein n=1 Tax=Pseudaminobacter soli (ex Zhang et al. 2022) TaxID=2831468 RepID=A0A942DYS3_9HYPH|nr:ABC transporter ATP-binding protein [Pseudaminobacter soli]MBS3650101.1 ABC transporter ATP-binding protein [Pseudaminobacter soli]